MHLHDVTIGEKESAWQLAVACQSHNQWHEQTLKHISMPPINLFKATDELDDRHNTAG